MRDANRGYCTHRSDPGVECAGKGERNRPSIWTCKQFQSANRDEIRLILAWLDGYYRAEDDPPVVDTNQLDANAKKLGTYCAAHPDIKLITAADSLFERE